MRVSTNSGLYSARPNKKPRYSMLEAIDFFHEAGFEAVDINFCATIYGVVPGKVKETVFDGDWEANVRAIKERADLYGMPTELSHLPFFKYKGKDTPNLDHFMEMTYRSLDANVILGTKWTVAHLMPDNELALEYLRPICKYATERNIGIAVENTTKSTIEALCYVVDTLASEGYVVGMCLDVGHANFAGLDAKEVVYRMGDRLKMLHIHDNYGDRDAHQPPYSGNIDWDGVMRALADIGFEGDLNFEPNTANIPEDCRLENAKYFVALGKSLIAKYEARRAELGK